MVDDFEVDVNDLRDDLKLENKEYVKIMPTSFTPATYLTPVTV